MLFERVRDVGDEEFDDVTSMFLFVDAALRKLPAMLREIENSNPYRRCRAYSYTAPYPPAAMVFVIYDAHDKRVRTEAAR